jgi:hypothetical protein
LTRFTRQRFSALKISTAAFFLVILPLAILNIRTAARQQGAPQTKNEPQMAPEGVGQISGHVYRADDGAPIAMATVTLTMVV